MSPTNAAELQRLQLHIFTRVSYSADEHFPDSPMKTDICNKFLLHFSSIYLTYFTLPKPLIKT